MLILNDAQERAKEIALFAAKPENWYRIGESTFIPGDRPEYVLTSGTTRAVFTWTRITETDVRRHMSISVMSRNYPNPVLVWTLAHMFGFTGSKPDASGVIQEPSKTWAIGIDDDEHCIVVQEKVLDLSPS